MGYMWVGYGIDVGQICDRNRIGIKYKWDSNGVEMG